MSEIHELPDARVACLLNYLFADVSFNRDLAREAEVGTVDTCHTGEDVLETRHHVGKSEIQNSFAPLKNNSIAILIIPIAVDHSVGDRFVALWVKVFAFEKQGNLRGVIGDDLAVLGEHEDREFGLTIGLFGVEIAGYDRIGSSFSPSPVPVVEELRHVDISPVVVLVTDASQSAG